MKKKLHVKNKSDFRRNRKVMKFQSYSFQGKQNSLFILIVFEKKGRKNS